MTGYVSGEEFKPTFGFFVITGYMVFCISYVAESDLLAVREQSQALSQSEGRFRSLFNAAMEGIILHEEGIVIDVNPAFERLFGCSMKDARGRHLSEFVQLKTSLPPGTDPLSGLAVPTLHSVREVKGTRRDGSKLDLEVTSRSGHEYQGRKVQVMTLYDITERNQIRRSLIHARDHALESNQAKSAFLANMSHEFRTPLNAILGYSELLQEEAEAMDGMEELLPDIERICMSSKHLLGLISDVLDLAEIESGQISFEIQAVPIHDLVRSVVISVELAARANGNTIEMALDPRCETLETDPQRLRQVLFNLLSNAAKFTHNGQITVKVIGKEIDGCPGVAFSVRDTGIGMTPEELALAFDPFMQADTSSTRRYGGTGTGLALSRRLITLIGGWIEAHSTPGHGSVFTVWLPQNANRTLEPLGEWVE